MAMRSMWTRPFGGARALMALAVLSLVMVGAGAIDATAQTVGLGVRAASVSGADTPILAGTDAEKGRFYGAHVRIKFGQLALEGSVDYKKFTDEVSDTSIKSYPIQGSVLYYLAPGSRSLYLLGGIGYYTQDLDLIASGEESFSTAAHEIGYHVGGGLEFALGRRAALHVDYRYLFVDPPNFGDVTDAVFGNSNAGNEGVNMRGSMWTGGLTVYF